MVMLYFKAPGRCIHKDSISAEWGAFVRWVEVGDDRFAARQVEIFGNGNILRYDRTHWCDDFAMMVRLRFSHKPKWAFFFPGAEVISAAEFEKVWRQAQQSDAWHQQINTSRVSQFGPFC